MTRTADHGRHHKSGITSQACIEGESTAQMSHGCCANAYQSHFAVTLLCSFRFVSPLTYEGGRSCKVGNLQTPIGHLLSKPGSQLLGSDHK